jgi:hypothetical protein
VKNHTYKDVHEPVCNFDKNLTLLVLFIYVTLLCDVADGVFLVEVGRLLRPGGYFVWTSTLNTHRALRDKENQKKWTTIRDLANKLCWEMLSQQDETIVWKKTNKRDCYSSRY